MAASRDSGVLSGVWGLVFRVRGLGPGRVLGFGVPGGTLGSSGFRVAPARSHDVGLRGSIGLLGLGNRVQRLRGLWAPGECKEGGCFFDLQELP